MIMKNNNTCCVRYIVTEKIMVWEEGGVKVGITKTPHRGCGVFVLKILTYFYHAKWANALFASAIL